jgi:hypothetical protein
MRFAGGFGASLGVFDAQFPSQLRDISPLDGKPPGSDAPRGFDRSAGEIVRRPE